MLLLSHIGYSVEAVRLARGRLIKGAIDFRLVIIASILPDIIDRLFFIFILPDARGGRLFAHTLIFHLLLIAILTVANRRYLLYGLVSLGHILLDDTKLEQALWPFLGAGLNNINISPGYGAIEGLTFWERVIARLGAHFQAYAQADLWSWLLELGGFFFLLSFFLRERLYHLPLLLDFLIKGIPSDSASPSKDKPKL